MSLGNENERDHLDLYIGNCLKNYVAQYPPSTFTLGREEFLLTVSSMPTDWYKSRSVFGLIKLGLRLVIVFLSILFKAPVMYEFQAEVGDNNLVTSSSTYFLTRQIVTYNAFPAGMGI